MTKPTIRLVQPAKTEISQHILRSLIRVFADRICLLQPLGNPKKDKGEFLPFWVDIQADLGICWSHRSHCRYCCVQASIIIDCDFIFCVFSAID